jgi:hypothetical protein
MRVSDPDIRCDLKDSLWRVTELAVVCVWAEDESLSAKYPAGPCSPRLARHILPSQAEWHALALERLHRSGGR